MRRRSPPGGAGIDPRAMIPNSAAAGHGPGRAACRRGPAQGPRVQLVLPFGQERWTSAELLRFCGECHRHQRATARADPPRRPDAGPAQPIGLSMSDCYRGSGGLDLRRPAMFLGRASSERAWDDTICLRCHGRPAQKTPPLKGAHFRGGCTVSPRQGCVECHMPRINLRPNLTLSDHWIRIHKEEESNQSSPEKGSADADGR